MQELYIPEAQTTIYVVRTPEDVLDVELWQVGHKYEALGLDIETNGRYPWHEGFAVRTVQVSDETTSFVIVVEDDPRMNAFAADLIKRHPAWVAHFAENDIAFAHRGLRCSDGGSPIRWNQRTPHVADSQVPLAMYDPRTVTTRNVKDGVDPRIPRLKGLKDNTDRLLGPWLKQAEDELVARFTELAPVGHRRGKNQIKTWGFRNIANDDPAYLRYAGLDPVGGLRLFNLCRRSLQGQGRWGRARAALTEQWMLDHADVRYGMQLDERYVLWLSDQLQRSITENGRYLAQYGIGESGQGPAVGEAFTSRGIEPVVRKKNKQGQMVASWDKTAMALLKEHEHPKVRELAMAISNARRSTKFKSAYVDPMVRAVVHCDGAMHPSVRAIGTVTTRMSAQGTDSAGPVQQLPKKDTRVRGCVRASRGCVLVTADFEQGEPFVMAALSGDEAYLADLVKGDINSRIAELVYGEKLGGDAEDRAGDGLFDRKYGKAAGTVHYLMRQNAKAGWLAACYGCGANKLWETLINGLPATTKAALTEHGISGEGVLAQWRASYPKLWAFADAMGQQAFARLDSGHVIPLWDRYGVAEDGSLFVRNKPSRLGLNVWTQGTQADLLNVAMHRLNAWGWSWAFRFALHDELMLEVPEWMAEDARQALKAAMTITYRGVTLQCDAVIEGKTWLPQPEEFDADMSILDELEEAA